MKIHKEKYEELYCKWGYNENSLIMPSDRRNIRYHELLKYSRIFEMNDCGGYTILDAGCGFGDVISYLNLIGKTNFSYIGIDVVNSFLEEAEKRQGSKDEKYKFIKRDLFLETVDDLDYDFAISSQAFNWKYNNCDDQNYEVIFTIIEKLFKKCREGVAFNFFSDKVEYMKNGTAYHNPGRMIEFAYSLSNNVLYDNSCMPYEPTLIILKDTSAYGGVYNTFRAKHLNDFKNNIFVIKEK